MNVRDFAERDLWNVRAGSLRLDAGGPDHLAPLLGLRRHIGAELRGGEDHRRGGRIGEPRLDDRASMVLSLKLGFLGGF